MQVVQEAPGCAAGALDQADRDGLSVVHSDEER
jgi:hypothetical protein